MSDRKTLLQQMQAERDTLRVSLSELQMSYAALLTDCDMFKAERDALKRDKESLIKPPMDHQTKLNLFKVPTFYTFEKQGRWRWVLMSGPEDNAAMIARSPSTYSDRIEALGSKRQFIYETEMASHQSIQNIPDNPLELSSQETG